MKRTLIIAGIIVAIAVTVMVFISKATAKKDISTLYATAVKGQFEILVTTTGELQAEFSTDIRGPEIAQSRNIRSMDIKIQDLVPEGTEVKEGDFIASLDRTSFDNSLKDELDRLETMNNSYQMKLLDSAVTLSNLRDGIKNQTFTVEEADITLQQSKFEPPTTIREAEINLDKAKRTLEQMMRSYDLRCKQAKSDIRNAESDIATEKRRVYDLQSILSKFTITAPSSGMVIYKKDRSGTKRKIGSSINPFDMVVATLPDLKSLISKTYVNEIDISKVKVGQKVSITVDAFPERSYTGEVRYVANIGEQLPNADAKVFEVQIKVDGSDPILRPSMTTANKIVTKTIDNVTFIPLECVQTGEDSIPIVYMRNRTKHTVLLGEANENNVIVEQGVEAGDVLYLSTPEGAEKFKLIGQELKTVILEREKARKEEELRIKNEAERTLKNRLNMMNGSPDQFQNVRGAGGIRQFDQQGGTRGGMRGDTAAMRRRMMNMQNGQQRNNRDTTTNRKINTQVIQKNSQPSGKATSRPVNN
jgi:HlyD family secretion protein